MLDAGAAARPGIETCSAVGSKKRAKTEETYAVVIKTLFRRKTEPVQTLPAPSIPAGLRVFAVGDIHGRSDLLDRLHAMIAADLDAIPAAAGHLVYLGDYIDRGPDAAGVLERLAAEPLRGMARTLLRGNHEQMLLRFLNDASAGFAWRQLGGLETLLSYRVNVRAVLAEKGLAGLAEDLKEKMPQHHRDLLGKLEMSTSIGGYFFCHAGVRPGVALERQREEDLLWIRHEFLSSAAEFGKVVVHGHTPVDKPEFRPNRINIDTAAYASNRLTCLVLEGTDRRTLVT